MECDEVRKEYPDFKFEPCCESCHEDEEMGHSQDLWFDDTNHKMRHTCCAIGRGLYKLTRLEEVNAKSK